MNATEAVLASPEQLGSLALHGSPPGAGAFDAEREARVAAGFVAGFVGVPALAAAGAVLFMYALTALVLLAPLVAVALTWVAWRCNRRLPAEGSGPPAAA